jgi:hypothetical protein
MASKIDGLNPPDTSATNTMKIRIPLGSFSGGKEEEEEVDEEEEKEELEEEEEKTKTTMTDISCYLHPEMVMT